MTDLVRNARSALLISVVPLVLGAAACGQEDPAVDDGSGDEIFYDGDEKADGGIDHHLQRFAQPQRKELGTPR